MFSVTVQVFFSFLWVLLSLFLVNSWGFSYEIRDDIYISIILDSAFTSLLVFIFFAVNKSKIIYIFDRFNGERIQNFDRLWIFSLILMLVAVFEAIVSLKLIFSGAARHLLIVEYNRMDLTYILISNYFKILTPILFFFNAPNRIKIISVIGLLSVLMITASRNELASFIYFYFSLMIFRFEYKKLAKFSLLLFAVLSISLMITTFVQGRPISQGFDGIVDVAKTHFIYKSYSFFLAEWSYAVSGDFEKIFYPFFGYISDKLLGLFFNLNNPIDTEFVSRYMYLGYNSDWGSSYIANVVYPWWSWFTGFWGYFGLIIKAVYLYFLLVVAVRFKFFVTFSYLVYYYLYISSGGSLFMTFNSTVTIIIAIILDIMVLKKWSIVFRNE